MVYHVLPYTKPLSVFFKKWVTETAKQKRRLTEERTEEDPQQQLQLFCPVCQIL